MSLLKQFLLQIECVLRTLLPDPLYKVKGKINSAAEPQGRGWERDGHWESIAPVFEGLLSCCFFFLTRKLPFLKEKKIFYFGLSWFLSYPYKTGHGFCH